MLGFPVAQVVRSQFHEPICISWILVLHYQTNCRKLQSGQRLVGGAMVTVTICVGSSCSVRGSDDFADALERMIDKEGLGDRIRLVGAFCMEQCSKGISIRVNERQYREIHFLDAEPFFYNEILPCLETEEKE